MSRHSIKQKILKEGDLINIDVSAELNGFWADNGASFVLGKDINQHQKLVEASKEILRKAINNIKGGVKIADIGHLIETEAKKRGYKVIKNLGGHGIGRSLHEHPEELLNYKNRFDQRLFKKIRLLLLKPLFQHPRLTLQNLTTDGQWLVTMVATWRNMNILFW
ncbi:M24 family metallopeptidase [Niabella ginsengisoli]|uniref:M24 family metallopeptidase n=1 Tax=Niabella ginsengisoli TaxID=522298 RepID=A0ABS9SJW3_9BACT|nr:M24 family metallopeptidase [Niabella ginsengisoli]MCH5598615.1 M24 family metallopeptidase [Niabella ginsengisoli]